MTEPLKDKAFVEANPNDFRQAYHRASEYFRKFPGVAGVGFGNKRVGVDYKDNIAFVIFVREKKKEEELPPEQRIPPSFEGYPTDVRVVEKGVAEVCDNQTKYDEIQGGIQIMVEGTDAAGTLGCIVKRRNDRGRENVYLLTNKHVLYSPTKGAGADVKHPTKDDDSLGPVQPGGLYGSFPHPPDNPASPTYFIDAAIARINLDSVCSGCTCSHDTTTVAETSIVDLQLNGVNTIADVRDVRNDPDIVLHPQVFKVGRSTGKTAGIVRVVNAHLDADPPPDQVGAPGVAGENTIYIEFDVASTPNGLNCHHQARFTDAGDSGSIVVDANNRVIGLHTHRGVAQAPLVLIPSHSCHIVPILDYLNICIPCTTGTSHGSSKATDGSGLNPIPLELGDFVIPDHSIVFVSQADVTEEEVGPLAFPVPAPLSEEEEVHMRELLAKLRETERGRELHRAFRDVRREIGYLVRNCRPVKVAWHRNQGPAFLAHVLNHLKGHTAEIPNEVQGVTLQILLLRMSELLKVHGQDSLRRAIEQFGAELAEAAPMIRNAEDCIAFLRVGVSEESLHP
ncbi:MAG TPA: hypothetical protein VH437_23850 [Terriglobales bacterium]|jgi:hypothetical protein